MGETKDNPPAEEAKPEAAAATTTTLTTAASSVAASNTTTAPPAITSSAKNNTNAGGAKAANAPPTSSSKHPPKQTEEDMKRVAEIAKKKKEEWVKTNKDREFAHRSRTRSVEAYEKLEQVRVILQKRARFSQKSIQFFLFVCGSRVAFAFFQFVFARDGKRNAFFALTQLSLFLSFVYVPRRLEKARTAWCSWRRKERRKKSSL